MSGDPIAGIPTDGEIAVLGLARSGRAVALLLARHGHKVYASDASSESGVGVVAAELSAEGIAAESGGHDLGRVGRAAAVVASPGIPPSAPPLVAARERGVPVLSEIEVALRALRALDRSRVIAVTGTNGKSTTTAMIGAMLAGLGTSAAVAGNIGRALSEVALLSDVPEWISVELSSFQLHDTPSLAPAVGVLTNLSPDHLDRYASVGEYYADKALLFRNADAGSVWVSNADDADSARLTAGVAGRHARFSLSTRADAWLDAGADLLRLGGEELMPRGDLPLLGKHNVANALAAALAVSVADESFAGPGPRERIARALRNFQPLSHRLELLGEFRGVQWINDSKATNVGAALVALQAMERPTVLLLGGRHKGEPYAPLAAEIRRTVKRVLAYGEAAPLIAGDLAGVTDVRTLGDSFEEVVAESRKSAQPGDAVLLSPACSSYDMFSSFEERGDRFRQLALAESG
ncbi:MAG: UDP-N-acetylmuramoyl-L-alanine--D-glutamate ligase [Gemmatimonadaceae bacterium]|nr:UDP-N-acetylmuramoyl-L-alanine--D-glutamate ligase [Gemmatimonadaceae bacterium]